jgi:hypothetical protein
MTGGGDRLKRDGIGGGDILDGCQIQTQVWGGKSGGWRGIQEGGAKAFVRSEI